MKTKALFIVIMILLSVTGLSQKRIVFSPDLEPPSYLKKDTTGNSTRYLKLKDLDQGVGFRMFASSYGFGLGTFYRKQFGEDVAYQLELEITPGKSEREFENINIFGQTYTNGKVNSLILFPLTNAVYYRLFSEDIVENFRPFLTANGGAVIAYQYPYDPQDSFAGFGRGLWKLGFTAGIGFGADFGTNFTSLQGISVRYQVHYIPDATELIVDPRSTVGNVFLQKDYWFQGFQLSLNLGKMWPK